MGFFSISVLAENSITDFSYPVEWELVNYYASPQMFDDLTIHTTNKTRKANMEKNADPNVEYSFKFLKATDEVENNTYFAILGTFYMNPNNSTDDYRAKSELLKVSIQTTDGFLVEGGPLSTNSSTTVSTNIGGGLSIGFQGTLPEGGVTGSFGRTKTNSVWDLSVAGYREKIYSWDTENRRFKVEYDYIDPGREDVDFLESSTNLQYAVIFLVNNNEITSFDYSISLYVNFFYDGWLWNNYYDGSLLLTQQVNINTNQFS